jgi:hypothetical protein
MLMININEPVCAVLYNARESSHVQSHVLLPMAGEFLLAHAYDLRA